MLDVIGAGFGRTGTLSLKHALERLGFERCYHMAEVAGNAGHVPVWRAALRAEPVDWEALFTGYRAAVDWPVCHFWRELADRYPEARLILTVRDPESWYDSARDTIFRSMREGLASGDPELVERLEMVVELVRDRTFCGDLDDRANAIRVLREHEARVRAEAPPERLLVYGVGQGWAPLCAFLDRPVPDEPFPRVNTREEFFSRWRGPQPPGAAPG